MHPTRENLWKDKTSTGAGAVRDPGPFHALQLWEFPRMLYAGSPQFSGIPLLGILVNEGIRYYPNTWVSG